MLPNAVAYTFLYNNYGIYIDVWTSAFGIYCMPVREIAV